MWTLVAGLVVLGVYLFNSGVSDAPLNEELLAGFAERTQAWGISESRWDCIEERLRADGYVADLAELDESQLEAIVRLGPDAPLTDYPAFDNFIEGLLSYLDPATGCVFPAEMDTFQATNLEAADFFSAETVAVAEFLTPGCEEGSLADCDMLWMVTEVGSEAQNTALTCGGLNDPLDFESNSCNLEHQRDMEYQRLVKQCGTGFHPACDVLFGLSAVGSEDETLAASCGGKRDYDWILPCYWAYGYGTRD